MDFLAITRPGLQKRIATRQHLLLNGVVFSTLWCHLSWRMPQRYFLGLLSLHSSILFKFFCKFIWMDGHFMDWSGTIWKTYDWCWSDVDNIRSRWTRRSVFFVHLLGCCWVTSFASKECWLTLWRLHWFWAFRHLWMWICFEWHWGTQDIIVNSLEVMLWL